MAASLRGLYNSLTINTSFRNPHNTSSYFLFFRKFSSTLFIKGISFSTTDETLAEAFSKFGEVVQVNVVKKKTNNKSKGYGYVTFASELDAIKALEDMNGQLLDGRVVLLDKVSRTRRSRKDRSRASGPPFDGANS